MRQITSITSNPESPAVDHCPPAHPFTPHPAFSKALGRSSKDSSLQHTNRLRNPAARVDEEQDWQPPKRFTAAVRDVLAK